MPKATFLLNGYFNPRSPSGLRHGTLVYVNKPADDFNPRSPSGLRQMCSSALYITVHISIHAARVGCDSIIRAAVQNAVYFNPRSPSGLRLSVSNFVCGFFDFNPRSPSGLRRNLHKHLHVQLYFNPRSPSGLRRWWRS